MYPSNKDLVPLIPYSWYSRPQILLNCVLGLLTRTSDTRALGPIFDSWRLLTSFPTREIYRRPTVPPGVVSRNQVGPSLSPSGKTVVTL